MRKVLFAALFTALAVGVVPAAASTTSNTVAVSITSTAFAPKTVSVNVGDSVKWTNTSTVNQQVSCAKCPFTSPVLKAGDTYTFTFDTAGKFAIGDPQNTAIKGSVTVAAGQGSVLITAAPRAIRYGNSTTLSGTISSGASKQNVNILGKQPGQAAFTRLITVKTDTAGAYSATLSPSVNSSYQAKWATATSDMVTVHVQPRVTLAKVGSHRFRVGVRAGRSLAGKTVFFQTRNGRGTWVKVKRVKLQTAVTLGAPIITKATFTSKIRHGRRVRILLTSGQAAPFYIGARSNLVKS